MYVISRPPSVTRTWPRSDDAHRPEIHKKSYGFTLVIFLLRGEKRKSKAGNKEIKGVKHFFFCLFMAH